ncbi:MAG: signal peptidase II [Lachnospiraceae bacterium]|nr:signal peptidase II [Lachnospiraceae bacterium]
MHRIKDKMFLIFLLIFAILLAADQYTKYLAVAHLKGSDSIKLIDGVLELHYVTNTGAAWSLLEGKKYILLIMGVVILAALLFCLLKIPDHKKYNILYYLAGATAAGAVGNMIDRVHYGYVVDFIYFSLIDFPVFNVADICITVSVIILGVVILFVYKEDDFAFLDFRRKKHKELE